MESVSEGKDVIMNIPAHDTRIMSSDNRLEAVGQPLQGLGCAALYLCNPILAWGIASRTTTHPTY